MSKEAVLYQEQFTKPINEVVPSQRFVDLVRVYPVVKRPGEVIEQELEEKKPSEISFLNVVFLSKRDNKNTRLKILTPISEQLKDPHEKVFDGSLRVLSSQTSMSPNGFAEADKSQALLYTAPEKFEFTILDSNSWDKRRASLNVMEVGSAEGRKIRLIDPNKTVEGFEYLTSEDTIAEIKGLKPTHIYGSSVIGERSDVKQDNEQVNKKNAALESICQNLELREITIKRNLFKIINRIRALTYTQDPIKVLDEAHKDEILRAYTILKREDSMRSFREYEKENRRNSGDTPLEKNLGYWLGKDILYFAQVIADRTSEDFSTMPAESTYSVIRTMRFLRDTFRDSFQEAIKSDLSLQGFFSTLEEQSSDSQQSQATFEKIHELYTREDLFLMKNDFEKSLAEKMSSKFAKKFGLNLQEVKGIRGEVNRMLSSMVDESLAANPVLANNNQFHRLINEVQNANFAKLFILATGILPFKDVDPLVLQYTRFEAARSIAYMLKGMSIYPEYRELTMEQNHEMFQSLVEVVFGGIKHSQQYTLPVDGKQIQQMLFHRGKGDQEVIVDEKPEKTFASFLRKSLETPVDEIHDVYSYNVALVNGCDTLSGWQPEYKIEAINEMINHFYANAEDLFSEKYEVRIINDRNTFDKLLTYVAEEKNEAGPHGKRAGSNGNRIIRRKFILELTEKATGQHSHAEFNFYPILTLDAQTNGEFQGLLEKLGDDQNYALRRMIAPMTHPNLSLKGMISKYEADYPPSIYAQTSNVLRHVERNKNRNKLPLDM